MKVISANYLRKLREMRGLTLGGLSKETGLSVALISKVERGRTTLSPDVAKVLSDYYGVSVKPSRLIVTFSNEIEKKEPQYKIENRNLKNENKMLKLEIKELKEKINAIYRIASNVISD